MGSSGESCAKAIDASVGGLVWVRRRNGSWWPGRILSPDELAQTCSVSPKSGAPVKLLGREDASVDWYNLEKSKRVKAFRCGEYDECIKKAKAAAANTSRKAVKYARREDAIIHALEIESARLGKEHPDFFSRTDIEENGEHRNNTVEESHNSSNPLDDGKYLNEQPTSSEDNSNSAQELSQSGVSFEAPNHVIVPKEQPLHESRRRTPNDSEDDGTEGSKRMRGLDDLGICAVSSLKRKRSQVAHVHDFLKKKSRRRPLIKVLESRAMVSVPIMCEELPSPTGVQANESGKSFATALNNDTDSISGNGKPFDSSLVECEQKENEISSILGLSENGSSDRLFDVPLVAEEKHSTGPSLIVSCISPKAEGGAGVQSSHGSQVEAMSVGSEELNDSGSNSSDCDDLHGFSPRIEKGTSEWQLKGKRNTRHTSRKVGCHRPGGSQIKSRPVTEIQVDELRGWCRNVSHINRPTAELLTPPAQRLLPYRQSRFTVNPKYESSDFALRHHIADSSLYDVNIEVKASYRPQHVPYISLMSKLNGKPIIGHPLTVEVLDDDFCDNLLVSGSDLDDYPNKSPKIKTRKNGLLSKKIRKLSSLTGSHQQSREKKKPKPIVEKLKGPAVACVPLKIVFSRINEALNSSIRPTHRSIGL